MPIYEYACSSCGHEFELWHKIPRSTGSTVSEPRPRRCESCGKRTARRQMSVTSFSLKGGGWYADGYASSNGKGASRAERPKTSASFADSASASG